jgi:hypothetical protein
MRRGRHGYQWALWRVPDCYELIKTHELAGPAKWQLTLTNDQSNAVAQAISRRLLTVRARVRAWVNTYGKNGVFWDVTPCGSCKNRRFGGT